MDRDEAARRVTSRLSGVTGLRAEIDVTFESDDDLRSAGGALVAQKPDRVRMQCWGPLGSTVMDLAVRGNEALLFLPRERRAVRIDLARLADEPKAGNEDYRALLLVGSLLDELSIADMAFRHEEDPAPDRGSLLLLSGGRPVSRVVYSRRTLLPVTREHLVKPRYVIEFSEYRLFGEHWWPGVIRVDSGDRKLTVEMGSLETNPEIEGDIFEIVVPPGVDEETR